MFLKKMLNNNIICQFHYKPIFLFKNIFNQKLIKKDFEGSVNYYKKTVSLPIFPTLSQKNQKFIVKTIKTLFKTKNKLILN